MWLLWWWWWWWWLSKIHFCCCISWQQQILYLTKILWVFGESWPKALKSFRMSVKWRRWIFFKCLYLKVLRYFSTEYDIKKKCKTNNWPQISPLNGFSWKGNLLVCNNWAFRGRIGCRQAGFGAHTVSPGFIPDAVFCAGFILRLQAVVPSISDACSSVITERWPRWLQLHIFTGLSHWGE